MTVAAFLVLQILTLGAALFFVTTFNAFPNKIAENSVQIADQFRDLPGEVNAAVLNERLRQILEDSETSGTARNGLGFMLNVSSEQRILLGFVDADGKIIASAPITALPQNEKLSHWLSENSGKCLTQPLSGDTDGERLSTGGRGRHDNFNRTDFRRGRESARRVLVQIYAPFEWQRFFTVVIFRMRPLTADVSIFVGIVGTIFGFVRARKLTKRLIAVAFAARGWSKGNFALHAPETPRDEPGELGENLNRTPQSLKDLIALRQDIAALEERHRLARDLHDTVKQQIFSCAMQHAAIRKWIKKNADVAAERVDEAEKIVKNIQLELAEVLHELRPVKKTENLTELLHDYCPTGRGSTTSPPNFAATRKQSLTGARRKPFTASRRKHSLTSPVTAGRRKFRSL